MDLIIHQFKKITINQLSSKISSTYKEIREINETTKPEDDSNESTKQSLKNQKRNKFEQDIDIKA